MKTALCPAGTRFGRWEVLSFSHTNNSRQRVYSCRCECGALRAVEISHLKRGRSRSCGCLKKEICHGGFGKHNSFWRERHLAGVRSQVNRDKHRIAATTHGASETRLYHIWEGMLARCRNPNNRKWKYYGGKGIDVCQSWTDFAAFRIWAMANGYRDHLTIDRTKSWLGYKPSNCTWMTLSENAAKIHRER